MWYNNRRLIHCLTIVLLFVFAGCKQILPDKQQVIEKLYNAKVKSLKDKKDRKCQKAAIAEATLQVDSIIHKLLNKDLLDTLSFPSRPIKPPTPKSIIGTVDRWEEPLE